MMLHSCGIKILLAPEVVVAEGKGGEVDESVDEWEPGVLITSPCDRVSVSEGSAQKRGLIRWLKPILRGGGAGSHTLPNHVIGKRMVNTTLAKGHHAQTRRTARILLIFHMVAVSL